MTIDEAAEKINNLDGWGCGCCGDVWERIKPEVVEILEALVGEKDDSALRD